MRISKLLLGLGLASVPAATPVSAFGQATIPAPETVTPKTLQPPVEKSEATVAIPQAEALTPPPGADSIFMTPTHIIIENAFSEVAKRSDTLARSAEGRRLSLAQIYHLASEIEAIHARQGFVFARAVVPPQRLVDQGTLRILVVDGFIENIDTSRLPGPIRAAVATRLESLRNRSQLKVDQIEPQLLIAGEVAGASLRSTLARGNQPGGVSLIVEGTWHPLRVTLRQDNALDRSLGDATSTLQFSTNSLFGLGETLYGYAATSNPLRPFAANTSVRVLGAGFSIAPGNGRLSLNPEFTFSRTLPRVPANVPRSEGDLLRYAFRAGYLLTVTRARRVALDLSLETLDQRTTAIDFSTDLARDHYAVTRLGVSASNAGQRASWNVSVQLGQGLGGLGGTGDAPPTRQKATANFSKVTGQAHAAIALGPRLSIAATALGQSSFGHALLRAEQFQLEGNEAVSAYIGGVTVVDEGVTARIEAKGRIALTLLPLAPYAFVAAGYGRIVSPTALEVGHLSAAAIGAGVRTSILKGHAELGAEFAYGKASAAAVGSRQRLNLVASIRL